MLKHHFTVDVEEYFHPTAMSRHYPLSSWGGLERRSPGVIARVLEFLAARRARATFFVVGWLAEREPEMVRAIAEAGHEVASHGYEHELVGRLGTEGFRSSVRRSKAVLEGITGEAVSGYRAPSFSIVPGLEWAFDVLLEEGYRYDASLFPIRQHPTYGYADAERDPHWIERRGGRIAEFPATTARVFGATLPASGGAYFRLLPYQLVQTALTQATNRQVAGMFYIHPWELDDWAPTVTAPRLQKLRTFAGRKHCWQRLERLFHDFEFKDIRSTLGVMEASTAT
jgi:polysaccharide deacetylase family protein (PEP-CTERM system associated)